MVDFQSRDTSRGLSSDDDEDEADESTASEPEEQAEDPDPADAETGATAAESDQEEPADSSPTAGGPASGTDPDHDAHDHADDDHNGDGHDHTDGDGHGADHEHGHADDHSHADHHHGDVEQLGVAVVTVSSSRDLETDPSGDAIQSLVEADGHSVVARDLVGDDLDGVQRTVLALTGREDVDVVVTTGGTGVTPDDVTVEAVRPLFDKELPGFGELFRILSYEEVGTRALGSRTTAGVSEGVPVFCLPGSEDAVRTGVQELILAEAPHLVGLARDE